MTTKLITAHEGLSLEHSKELLHKNRIEKLLVVDDAGRLRGLITIKDIEKAQQHPDAVKDDLGRLRVGAAVGTGPDRAARTAALLQAGADVICIDTAHGHSKLVLEAVADIRKTFPKAQIIAGNVATAEGALALAKAGANAVKVGIGAGSICTTRVIAGIGVPQMTAVTDAAHALAKLDVRIVSDGGVKYSGDITKAIAAGAHTVMIGSLFAGSDEAPGEIILYQGRSYKVYRGMGSVGAMRAGSRDRYFQSDVTADAKLVPEGIEGRVPYRGSLSQSMYKLIGGLRSGMGYCGCRNIAELHSKARFIRITQMGLRESHVHDVIITKEAPNYRVEQ
jgi:IMP dehydrogenase